MKSDTVSMFYPSIWHKVIGLDAMILVFGMLSFEPTFLLYFTFIKKLYTCVYVCVCVCVCVCKGQVATQALGNPGPDISKP